MKVKVVKKTTKRDSRITVSDEHLRLLKAEAKKKKMTAKELVAQILNRRFR